MEKLAEQHDAGYDGKGITEKARQVNYRAFEYEKTNVFKY